MSGITFQPEPQTGPDKTLTIGFTSAEGWKTQVTIYNSLGWELDPGMFNFVMRMILRHAPNAHTIDVYPQKRIPMHAPAWKGWLEWTMRVHYRHGGAMTIGCIQRNPSADFESHT